MLERAGMHYASNVTRAVFLLIALSACGGRDFVDSGSDSGMDGTTQDAAACAIDKIYEPGELACCNGTLCRGVCTKADACDCGGIVGGCHAGSVCCQGVCTGSSFCTENV